MSAANRTAETWLVTFHNSTGEVTAVHPRTFGVDDARQYVIDMQHVGINCRASRVILAVPLSTVESVAVAQCVGYSAEAAAKKTP